jgi:hypothetical protein
VSKRFIAGHTLASQPINEPPEDVPTTLIFVSNAGPWNAARFNDKWSCRARMVPPKNLNELRIHLHVA